MWKYLNQSVAGTSHAEGKIPCQDFSVVVPYTIGDEEVLIVACSDGAGSASQAQVGSELASKAIVAAVAGCFDTGRAVTDINDETVGSWFRAAHERIKSEADQQQISLREFSCTLLLGVIGGTSAIFAQVGDGAIVIGEGARYRAVCWPDSGEYHNTTYFVVDPKFSEHLQMVRVPSRVDEVACFSDGLQMLALDYSTHEAHGPFFSPLFRQLREHQAGDLIIPMREFLDSKPVNDLTDDDKTLVLAVRERR